MNIERKISSVLDNKPNPVKLQKIKKENVEKLSGFSSSFFYF